MSCEIISTGFVIWLWALFFCPGYLPASEKPVFIVLMIIIWPLAYVLRLDLRLKIAILAVDTWLRIAIDKILEYCKKSRACDEETYPTNARAEDEDTNPTNAICAHCAICATCASAGDENTHLTNARAEDEDTHPTNDSLDPTVVQGSKKEDEEPPKYEDIERLDALQLPKYHECCQEDTIMYESESQVKS